MLPFASITEERFAIIHIRNLKKHDYFVSKRSIEETEMFQIKIILNYSMSKGEKLKVFF